MGGDLEEEGGGGAMEAVDIGGKWLLISHFGGIREGIGLGLRIRWVRSKFICGKLGVFLGFVVESKTFEEVKLNLFGSSCFRPNGEQLQFFFFFF